MKKTILIIGLLIGIINQGKAQAFKHTGYESIVVEQHIETLFPNPALNNATVILNYLPDQKVYVDIIDFNGNLRRSFAFLPHGRQLSFDVGFLEEGYYIIRVREGYRLIDITRLLKS